MASVNPLPQVKKAEDISTDEEVKSEEAKPEPTVAEEKPEEQVRLDNDGKQTRFLSEELNNMLNEQISFEMFSAYLYFMIAAWSQAKGLTGFQAHFEKQGQGEICHAMKVYQHLVSTGSKIDLPAIPSPTGLVKSSNMQEACRAALDHEMVVTARWQKIGEKAKSESNMSTIQISLDFIAEQVEEEDLSLTLLNRVELSEGGAGLLIIDAGLK